MMLDKILYLLVVSSAAPGSEPLSGPRAQETAEVTDSVAVSQCRSIWSMHSLSSGGRRRIFDVCAKRSEPTLTRDELWILGSQPGWQGAAIARLLASSSATAGEVGARQRALTAAIAALSGRSSSACRDLTKRMDEYVTADEGETIAPPLTHRFLAAEAAGCLGPSTKDLSGSRILTARVSAETVVSVLVSSHASISLLRLDQSDFVVWRGQYVLFLPVPENSAVSMSADVPSLEFPRTWHGIATHDKSLWNGADRLSCISLSSSMDPETVLLLDGTEIEYTASAQKFERNILVPEDDHELVAMRCKAGSECSILTTRRISNGALTGVDSVCRGIKLDAQANKDVGVIMLPLTSTCPSEATGERDPHARLMVYAREWLSRNGMNSVDLTSLAHYQAYLKDLDQQLSKPDEAKEVSESHALHAGRALFAFGAQLWDQGLESLMFMQLACSSERSKPYEVRASLVSLASFQDSRNDILVSPDGLAVRDAIVVIENTRESRAAVHLALAKLFARSYHTLLGATSWRHGWDRQEGVITALYNDPERDRDASRALLMVSHRARNATECGRMKGLRIDEATRSRVQVLANEQDVMAGEGRLRVPLRKITPGAHSIVLGSLESDGRIDVKSEICVASEPVPETWVQLTPAVGLPYDHRDERTAGLMAIIGHAWALRRRRCLAPFKVGCALPLGLGVAGGYLLEASRALRPPGWLDLAASTQGKPLSWQKHSAILYPFVEFRMRRPRADWVSRVGPIFSVGRADTRGIPASYTEFRSYDPRVDFDVGVMLQTGASIVAWRNFGLAPMLLLAVSDLAYRNPESQSVYLNHNITIGAGIGFVLGARNQ